MSLFPLMLFLFYAYNCTINEKNYYFIIMSRFASQLGSLPSSESPLTRQVNSAGYMFLYISHGDQ